MVPTNLLVLISCDPNELRLFEDECSEGGVGELEDVAGSHQVEPRLILVHRVQDCLEISRKVIIIIFFHILKLKSVKSVL